MNDQKLIDALIARASDDARAFREKHPGDAPTERWIENSYTAALPLVGDDAGVELGRGPHPNLFSAYRNAIERAVGERVEKRDASGDLEQQPTPGER